MKIYSIHDNGNSGITVTAETSMSNGLPAIVLVGFAGKSLDESRERIRNAFSSSNLSLPRKRITVNMSPSDIPKDGAHYDLAIALSILWSAKMIRPARVNPVVLGELGLDGTIKPVRGILGKLIAAIAQGHTHFIIPKANYIQASLLNGIHLYPVETLTELVQTFTTEPNLAFTAVTPSTKKPDMQSSTNYTDFSEIVGQSRAKRALEIAAAGSHNVLLNGPPGVGKSMLAKSLPGILPELRHDEMITVTHIHSLVSDTIVDLIVERPFRAPHHSASDVSVIGGGTHSKPGEVSLAHKGVLFLDEIPEFKRATIESLRQPLEDGNVTIARAKNTATYPAEFMLIATQNPCPCGYYGSSQACTCSAIQLQRYQEKLSGPIIDRIDIHVTVDNVAHDKLLSTVPNNETSGQIRSRVNSAVARQHKRYSTLHQNAQLTNKEIKTILQIDPEAKELLDKAAANLGISARVYMKIIKIAQTIADLDEAPSIGVKQIAEALQYRPQKA